MHEIHQSHDHLISFVLNEGKIKKLITTRGTCIHNQQNEWSMIHQNFLTPQNLRIVDHIYKIFDKMAHENVNSVRGIIAIAWHLETSTAGRQGHQFSCHFWTSKFEPPLIFCTTTNPHVAGDTTTTNFNIQLICYNCTGLKMAC